MKQIIDSEKNFIIHDKVTNRKIIMGESIKPPVIAELGINHNGSLERALQMADAASQAGAKIIKVQTFDTDEFMSDRTQSYTYFSQGKKITESMYNMFKRCELTFGEFEILFDHIRSLGLIPISTATDIRCARKLMEYGLPAVKTGSDDLVNVPLLRQLAGLDIPMIISTGMAKLHEIKRAVQEIANYSPSRRLPLVMVCTSSYPAQASEVNLNRLNSLKKEFSQTQFTHINTGFSDHTQSWHAAFLACACRACVIEKHFTLDHNLSGPDHWFSNNPKQLEELVKMVDQAWEILGTGEFEPSENENSMRIQARRSITAARNLPAGHKVTLNDLVMQRPGTGIMPDKIDQVSGKFVNRPVKKGEQIDLESLTNDKK
jgi:N-acetylneuraminate synthase/N,N'-diacetyllegionaminate synthase